LNIIDIMPWFHILMIIYYKPCMEPLTMRKKILFLTGPSSKIYLNFIRIWVISLDIPLIFVRALPFTWMRIIWNFMPIPPLIMNP